MRKLFLLVATACLTLAVAGTAQAAAKLEHPEEFKVTKEGHEKALKIAKENKIDLSNLPFPVENLTTDIPKEAKGYDIRFKEKQSRGLKAYPKIYDIDRIDFPIGISQVWFIEGYYSRYLVPVNYVPKDNAIYSGSVVSSFTSYHSKFYFRDSWTEDTGVGAYGDGGYYWRRFTLYTYPNYSYGSVTVWLSAWDKNHLVYG